MSTVPTSIKVLSILGIVYAAMVLLGVPCGVFLNLHPLTPSPLTDDLLKRPWYVPYTLVTSAINFLMGVLLLAASIGSMKLRKKARVAMLVYAWAAIVQMIVGSLFTGLVLLPIMESAGATPGVPGGMVMIIGIVSLVGGIIFASAISGVLIYFFTRKANVDAFNGIFPEAPTNFPVEYPDQPLPPDPTPPA